MHLRCRRLTQQNERHFFKQDMGVLRFRAQLCSDVQLTKHSNIAASWIAMLTIVLVPTDSSFSLDGAQKKRKVITVGSKAELRFARQEESSLLSKRKQVFHASRDLTCGPWGVRRVFLAYRACLLSLGSPWLCGGMVTTETTYDGACVFCASSCVCIRCRATALYRLGASATATSSRCNCFRVSSFPWATEGIISCPRYDTCRWLLHVDLCILCNVRHHMSIFTQSIQS